jgi:acyl carrier protein
LTDDILQRLKRVLVEEFKVPEEAIRLEAKLAEDFRLDSVEGVELIFSLEEEFGVEISDQEMEGISTLGDLVEAAKRKLGEKAADNSE